MGNQTVSPKREPIAIPSINILATAAHNGDDKCVERQLKRGCDVNEMTTEQCTALVAAIEGRRLDIVKYLVSVGADVNKCSSRFREFNYRRQMKTPLEHAIANRYLEAVLPLLKAGADVEFTTDHNGRKPLHIASIDNSRYLLDLLLDCRADVNCRTKDKQTPLHYACKCGHQRIVEKLLAVKADVNALDDCGWSPLHCVCQLGNSSFAEILLKNGADANLATIEESQTALHYACLRDDNITAKLLLELTSVNVNLRSNSGFTPLHYACHNRNVALAQRLIEHGADCAISNDDGESPLDLCKDASKRATLEAFVNEHLCGLK